MKSAPISKTKKAVSRKKSKEQSFPIVAIGASVGGLEAMSTLLKNLPVNTGMAFIYVQHLDPNHKSFLASILSGITKMKVQEVEDMAHIAPDNVYIIPHNKGIEVTDGHIKLLPRSKGGAAISIDVLFSSLAQTHKENVIGVILSGNASDGTHGLKSIKDAGGLTFAQDDSAQASSMPKSAIAAGVVDFVLSPKGIARKLIYFSKMGLPRQALKGKLKEGAIEDSNPDLKIIYELLHKETGVDFSHYKLPTIKRRLTHRMLQCGTKTIKEYAKLLLKKNAEVDLLYGSLLINVTGFFRDTEAFAYLKSTFLPKVIKSKLPGETLRIWVPACSSGEEAYSIAILITELQDKKTKKVPVQIFATDLSEQAINDARVGEYSAANMKSVSKKYTDRFFTKAGDNYRIAKEIREMCVFAPHNILRDPPFSRMDFISCCNMLIYFDTAAQKKIFATMHFALNDKGYLMLGKAESIGTSSQLFSRVNNKFKIYSRKKNIGTPKILELTPHFSRTTLNSKKVNFPAKSINTNPMGVENAIDSALLSHYMPACAVVNKDMEILQFRGKASLYLTHSPGKASLNILKMARPEFAFELRNALNRAIETKQAVYKSGIEIEIESVFRMMSLDVSPLKIDWDEQLLLIVFTLQEQVEKFVENGKGGQNNSTQKDRRIKKLTEELNNTRAEMNTIIESQETTYEELQAANEEIVSTNEEFQTLNEELETSKEEIQASNEELLSTNHELQTRNDLLTESYEYSEAIIATVHEPMLVLNKDLYIKSANKSFYKKFLVKKEETEGKFLFDLGNNQWDIPKLRELLNEVISKNNSFQNFEVTHTFPGIGEKIMLLNAHLIIQKTHSEQLILLAIEDITVRTRYHLKEKELLTREKEIAEGSVNSKQQFLSNMSHEIRTPMNAIVGFTKVVLKTDLNEKQKEYINAIKVSGDALIVLINDILDLAKVDAGKMTFEQTPFKLAASISAMLHLFETKIQEKNLELVKEYDTTIPEVIVGDPVRLHQIILNLVSNAVKFTAKGKITVHIHKLKENADSVTIKFAITDTGIGIAEGSIKHIFDDFQQATSETSRIYGGTGLGLAIVKQLVEQQGGSITVNSKIGKGSSFVFTLSFTKTTEKIPDEAEIVESLKTVLNNVHILVVEDIPLNQLLMKTLLEEFGFAMDIAGNGKIAIEKLKKSTYDIILMDLQMPEMDGFETTEYIRTKMNLHTPIIALTADVTTVDVEKCKAIGMNDYISKPVDERILYNKIIRYLKRSMYEKPVSEMEVNKKQETCINLDYLKRVTKNNPVVITEMIKVYLEETPRLLENMKQAMDAENWETLKLVAHSIIPSFSTMGIDKKFENKAKKIQEYAISLMEKNLDAETKKETIAVIHDLFFKIKSICTRSCEELKKELLVVK
jgi:two-component system, chemotaxis family, CheB/CheR fusion protein